MNTKLAAIVIGLSTFLPLFGQFSTQALDPNIQSLRVRWASQSSEDDPQRPYLQLINGHVTGDDLANTLHISWDEMSHDLKQYTYTVQHLNADFTPSDLQGIEYMEGFTTQDVTDYQVSDLTQRLYTHYQFTFPNQDIQLKTSGNYVILVYQDGNPEKVALTVCFSVLENRVPISAQKRANTNIEINGRYQQLDIDIDTRHLNLTNPEEIKLVVKQNNRQDNLVYCPKPNYIEPQRIRYINNQSLIFEGGNEYRHLDIFSKYYAGYQVDRVRYDNNDYHAFLSPDANRGSSSPNTEPTGSPYIYHEDTNGQWLVNAERTDDADIEAEYMWVHWVLPMDAPFFDGIVYVGGDLFQNLFTYRNRMEYDNDRRAYVLSALLKQGAYEYQFWFVDKSQSAYVTRPHKGDPTPSYQKGASLLRLEGSHWQTNNRYEILVYYHPFGGRYDQLVGYQVLE